MPQNAGIPDINPALKLSKMILNTTVITGDDDFECITVAYRGEHAI